MARRPVSKEARVALWNFSTSARLATLGEDGFEVWASDPHQVVRCGDELRGGFVRVQPPATASDEAVEAVRRRLLEAGAAGVRVLPRLRAAAAPVPAEALAVPSVREVVLELVAEVPSRDRDKLRGIVEGVMAEAGI